MQTFLKVVRGALMVFGVLFLIEIIFIAWFFIYDPLNLKGLFSYSSSTITTTGTNSSTNSGSQTSDKNPLLTTQQEQTLQSLGVDPASLPSTITPEMESCFVDKLGQDRVNQIKAGESPSISDYLKAKSCL